MGFGLVFYFDWVSVSFFGVVMLVSSVVMFYVNFYIGVSYRMGRFFWMVFFFLLSMVFLIFSPNLFRVILGWDGLGISSYLLVCYYDDLMSYFSGVVVFLNNRLGDVFFLLSFYNLISMGDLDG